MIWPILFVALWLLSNWQIAEILLSATLSEAILPASYLLLGSGVAVSVGNMLAKLIGRFLPYKLEMIEEAYLAPHPYDPAVYLALVYEDNPKDRSFVYYELGPEGSSIYKTFRKISSPNIRIIKKGRPKIRLERPIFRSEWMRFFGFSKHRLLRTFLLRERNYRDYTGTPSLQLSPEGGR